MKICVINSLFDPYSRGGVEVVVENIIEGFHTAGHEVFLITLGRKKEKESARPCIIYRIKPVNIFSFIDIQKKPFFIRAPWHVIDAFNISGARQVKEILENEKPDIVMTHNLKGIGYLIPRMLKKLKIKHVHYIHDVQLSRPSGLMLYGQEKPFLILDKIYEKTCRYFFGSPDIIISPSKWLMEYYSKRGFFYNSKKMVLPNPIKGIKENILKESRDVNKTTFLYVGQIEKSKGIIFLVETMKKMEDKNWILKIVGEGAILDRVREATYGDDHFQIYGYMKHSGLSIMYNQADFTIVPSLCYENSPTVIYESFSHGVPVIASDIGGVAELVKDNVNGFTFVPGNEENLLEVLKYCLAHSEEREKLSKNSFETIKEFALEKYIQKLLILV